MIKTLATVVQVCGFLNKVGTPVVLYESVLILLSSRKYGPSSANSPKYEAAPGPPFVHTTTGSFLGSLSDSMKI